MLSLLDIQAGRQLDSTRNGLLSGLSPPTYGTFSLFSSRLVSSHCSPRTHACTRACTHSHMHTHIAILKRDIFIVSLFYLI